MITLKITQPGWDNYNGMLGGTEFVNSVSAEPVTQIIANRLSAVVQMVQLDANGDEQGVGITFGMVAGKGIALVEPEPLKVASQEDIDDELRLSRMAKGKPPVDDFHTIDSLNKIADDLGIGGIREAAKPWGVKERSIPKLITMILEAQEEFRRFQTGEALVKSAEVEVEPEVQVEIEVQTPVQPDLPDAAVELSTQDEVAVTNARI